MKSGQSSEQGVASEVLEMSSQCCWATCGLEGPSLTLLLRPWIFCGRKRKLPQREAPEDQLQDQLCEEGEDPIKPPFLFIYKTDPMLWKILK